MTAKTIKEIKLEYTRTNNSSGNACLKYDEVYVIVKAGSEFEENSNVNAPTETIARLAQFNNHSAQGCFVDNQGNFTSSKVTALSNDENEDEGDSAILSISIPDRPIKYYLSIWGYGRSNNRLYGPFFHEIDNSSSSNGKTPYEDIKVTNLRRYSSEYSREILYENTDEGLDINTLQFSYFVALPESEKIYFQELPKRICIVYKNGTPVLYLYGEDLITLYKHTEEQMSESEKGQYLDILSIPYIFFSPLINKQFEGDARKLTNDENLIDIEGYKYFNPLGNSSNLKFIMDEAFTEDENGYTLWVGSYDPSASLPYPSLKDLRDDSQLQEEVKFDIVTTSSSRIVISGNPSVKSGARFTKALGNYNSLLDPEKQVKVNSTALSCVLNTYESSESELVLTLASTKDFTNENNNENAYLNTSTEEKRFLSVKDSKGDIIRFPIFNFHKEEFYGVANNDEIILTNQNGNTETIVYNNPIEDDSQLKKIKEGEFNSDIYDIKIRKSDGNEYPLVQQIENSFYFYSPYPLENEASFILTKENGGEVSTDYDLTIIFSDEDSQNVDQVVYEAVNEVDETGSQAINSFSKEMTAELEGIEGLVIFFSQTEFSLSKEEIENFEIQENDAIPKFNYFYSVRRPETWPISNISINGKSSSQIAKKDILCRYYIQDFSTMNFENNSLTVPIEEAENWKEMYAIIATFNQSALDSNFKNQAPYLIEFPMYSNFSLRNPNIGIGTRGYLGNGQRVTKNKRLAYVDKNNKLKYWKQHISKNSNSYKNLEEQEVAILKEDNENKILYFYVPTILSDRSLAYSIPAPENGDYKTLDEQEIYWRYMFNDEDEFNISEDYNDDSPLGNGLYSISLGNAEYGEQLLRFELLTDTTGSETIYKAKFKKTSSTGIVNKEDLGNTFEITNVQGQTATVILGGASMQIQKIDRNKESLKLDYVTNKITSQDRYYSTRIHVQPQED